MQSNTASDQNLGVQDVPSYSNRHKGKLVFLISMAFGVLFAAGWYVIGATADSTGADTPTSAVEEHDSVVESTTEGTSLVRKSIDSGFEDNFVVGDIIEINEYSITIIQDDEQTIVEVPEDLRNAIALTEGNSLAPKYISVNELRIGDRLTYHPYNPESTLPEYMAVLRDY